MEKLKEPIEAGLAPEWFRACMIGAGGIFVCCLTEKCVSVYTAHLDGKDDGIPISVIILLASLTAALLFTLGHTWRMRILSTGVELRFFVRIVWRWEDFKQAETGHYQVYFPHLPPWKRYLTLAYLEPGVAEEIWRILLEQVPPSDKWSGPIKIYAGPWLKLTFFNEGVNIRHFRNRYFSWDDLRRAVIFQSAYSERGFTKLHLVFGKRTYYISRVPVLRGRKKGPADYDVVEFLEDHVPEEKLVFCAHSGPACSIEEFEERKKVVAKRKLAFVLMLFIVSAYFLYVSYPILSALIVDSDLIRDYIVILAITAVLFFFWFLILFGILIVWRRSRNEEKQLDQSRDTLIRNEHE